MCVCLCLYICVYRLILPDFILQKYATEKQTTLSISAIFQCCLTSLAQGNFSGFIFRCYRRILFQINVEKY